MRVESAGECLWLREVSDGLELGLMKCLWCRLNFSYSGIASQYPRFNTVMLFLPMYLKSHKNVRQLVKISLVNMYSSFMASELRSHA